MTYLWVPEKSPCQGQRSRPTAVASARDINTVGATRSCAFVYYSVLASDENDLRCATGTAAPVAQTKRKSTRKPSANQRANHFPKDVRHFRNEAQTILPAAQTILPPGANHFWAWFKGWHVRVTPERSRVCV